ncbi:MAG: glycosyltransferase [Candidatus Omnitrophica bacterium]|nr:glycosyltransferase [Candidatus Omnitrophota bacterium]
MASISTVTLTFNEEEDITRCLESLQWADERIVIDSYSSDSTTEKARPLCTKVVLEQMSDFSSVRNRGIAEAKGDWVLMVDADEVITPELAEEIQKAADQSAFEGYCINRINYMYGVKLGHTQPDYQLRLFKRGKARYRNPVHEEAVVNGRVGRLNSSFMHYSMKDLKEHIEKMNKYTDISSSESSASSFTLFLKPFYRFIQVFFQRKAYRDGIAGTVLALNAFFYEFVNLFKIWERRYIRRDWVDFYSGVDIEKEITHQAEVHEDLIRSITAASPQTLLEVGSGSAAISFSIIKKKAIRIITVDNRLNILKKVKEDARKLGLDIEVVCADAFSLPFREGAFDVVFSQGVLEHFTDVEIKRILDEKLKVCTKSVFFSVPNKHYRHKDFGNERLLSKGAWEKLLTGFNIKESRDYYFQSTKRNFFRYLGLMYMCRIEK